MSGPLEGVRVLELAHWVAIPAATAILSDWGAEVIKVEDPRGGDAARGLMGMGIYPFQLEVSPSFEVDNRNKRSMSVNLQEEKGREIVYLLAKKADVFATNFEPSLLRRFSMEYETLRPLNPALIYVSLTGYGPRGPDRDRPGYDFSAYWARSGIMAILGEPQGPPTAARPGIGDHATSLAVAAAVSAALFARQRTGRGQRIDMALLQCALWQVAIDVQAALLGETEVARVSRKAVGNPLGNHYQAGDGRWLQLIMPQADRYWASFCQAIGRQELEQDPRFSSLEKRRENSPALIAILDEVFATKTRPEWGGLLDAHGCVWGVVQTVREIASDPQVLENQFLTPVEHPRLGKIRLVSSPGRFSETPSAIRAPAPEAGQHTEEVLVELGYSWEDIAQLKDAGAIP